MSVISRVRQVSMPRFGAVIGYGLTALLLAAVVMIALTGLLTPSGAGFSIGGGSALPDSSRLFAAQTAPDVFSDERLIDFPLPGGPAALSAVYIQNTDLVVFDINPATGQGSEAFRITQEQIATATAEAIAGDTSILVGQSPQTQVFVLPSGNCQINGLFPDGKTFSAVFDCVRL